MHSDYIRSLSELGMGDVNQVGGKNASLGEMIHKLADAGVRVPGGFATTAKAFWEFLDQGQLGERIHQRLDALDVENITALTETGRQIRQWMIETPLPVPLAEAIRTAYHRLQDTSNIEPAVAVRSSATAEDLPDASFAGQQETFLNIRGLTAVFLATHKVFASLFNDRAIAYRAHQGFDHRQVALSAGIQRMVRSDIGASGVMFTLDTESGFQKVVFITGNYGLGETVVQGSVNPDEFYVYKPALTTKHLAILNHHLGTKTQRMVYSKGPNYGVHTEPIPEAERQRFCITDKEILALAQQALIIEQHYGCPMDIEWARDGEDGLLYIVQARPETVQSRSGKVLERYKLKGQGPLLTRGRSIGQRIGVGPARIVQGVEEIHQVEAGDVLVTDMTDPDWEPVMKRSAAIVTNRGGRTCHAAIIARELGIPAVVGCGDATRQIRDGEQVTVSCAEGDSGHIYQGALEYEKKEIHLDRMPKISVKLMMNIGNPEQAFSFAAIPNAGIGLARLEFIINRMIGIHPKALLEFDRLPSELKVRIEPIIAAYKNPIDFYLTRLSEGVATLAAAFAPKPVIVRMSDFKSNEYANLIGGERYEPKEENPMLGFRGASRYISLTFRACFELECRALLRAREEFGFSNIELMIPFCRTIEEACEVNKLLAENGLRRGENGLRLIMMCEIPSNALLAEEFLEYFDGFSIGSNDLTQLTLGLDRDSALVAERFDERNPAVKALLHMAIQACRKKGKYIGICGQGPSDHPDLARWLLEQKIESMSLNPDTVVATWLYLAGENIED